MLDRLYSDDRTPLLEHLEALPEQLRAALREGDLRDGVRQHGDRCRVYRAMYRAQMSRQLHAFDWLSVFKRDPDLRE